MLYNGRTQQVVRSGKRKGAGDARPANHQHVFNDMNLGDESDDNMPEVIPSGSKKRKVNPPNELPIDVPSEDEGINARKKRRNPVPAQRAAALGTMANSLSMMAGAYAETKRAESSNVTWGKLLGEQIDRLDPEVQDDIKNDINNIVYRALKDK